MAKLTLSDITNTSNSSIAATVNANNDLVETALENTLSRDGTSPNSMSAELDMNSNAIINLPEPSTDTEPVRLGDLQALANGSTFEIGDLLDVDIDDPPNDDDFLRYDSASGKWVNEAAAGAGTAPDDVDYLVKTADAGLTAERVVTDSTSITGFWDTAGQVEFRRAALTGDVTASANSNATTIADEAVTLAKMAHVATDRLLGRDTAATGDVEALTVGGGIEFTGSGGIQRSALTGDVTASAGSNSTTISAGAVDLAMMANLAEDRIIGRVSSGAGVPEALTAAQVGSMLSIEDLSDVGNFSPVNGDVLSYNGFEWVNAGLYTLIGAPADAEYIVSSAHSGLSAERVVTNTNTINWDAGTAAQLKANVVQIPVTFVVACSDESTPITAGTAKTVFRMPHAMTLTGVRASLTTAQTGDGGGGIFTVDIHEGSGAGTTVLGTKLTIDNGELTSTTADAAATIADSSLADDAQITIDVDQIGDGTAAGLKVYLIGTRSV